MATGKEKRNNEGAEENGAHFCQRQMLKPLFSRLFFLISASSIYLLLPDLTALSLTRCSSLNQLLLQLYYSIQNKYFQSLWKREEEKEERAFE